MLKKGETERRKCSYLLHIIEIATRETIKTTPAAADPAIRGSCSLNSDLKSSVLHIVKDRQIINCLGGA